MSKDNMEELQRWSMEIVVRPGAYSYGNESVGYEHDPDGEWVRFSDVEELVARFQARIEELEAELDRLAEMDEHHAMTAVRQSEMIDAAEKLADALKAKWNARRDALKEGVLASTATEHDQLIHAYRALRSLLDSGEEQGCPDDDGVVGALRQSDSALTRLRSVLAREGGEE